MKPNAFLRLLSVAIPNNLPVLVSGAPGVGKTELVLQAVNALGARCIVSHPVVSDPTDYKGMPTVVPEQGIATFLPFDELAEALAATELTVWFIDDIGQAPAAVQAAVMQLLLARRINGKRLPDCVRFVAATNRRQDRAGVAGILEPVKSRFATIVELQTDVAAVTAIGAQRGWAPEVLAYLRLNPDALLDFTPTLEMTNSPSPRTWSFVSRWLRAGIDARDEQETFAGAIGDGHATQFRAFLNVYRHAPTPDVILLNPDTTPIPDNTSLLHAVVSALAAACNKQTFDRAFRYIARLPQEFGVFCIKDAQRRNEDVVESPAWMTYVNSPLGKLVMGQQADD